MGVALEYAIHSAKRAIDTPLFCTKPGCTKRTIAYNRCAEHQPRCGKVLGWNVFGKPFIWCGRAGMHCVDCLREVGIEF